MDESSWQLWWSAMVIFVYQWFAMIWQWCQLLKRLKSPLSNHCLSLCVAFYCEILQHSSPSLQIDYLANPSSQYRIAFHQICVVCNDMGNGYNWRSIQLMATKQDCSWYYHNYKNITVNNISTNYVSSFILIFHTPLSSSWFPWLTICLIMGRLWSSHMVLIIGTIFVVVITVVVA